MKWFHAAGREVFVDPDGRNRGTNHHHHVGGAAHEIVGQVGMPGGQEQQHEPGALAESERPHTRRRGALAANRRGTTAYTPTIAT